ncbi:hemolysin family protein [Deltaproteobacteria bacterium TL4]
MDLDLEILLRMIALGVLIVFSAFFSGSETALFSLSKLQLQKIKERNSLKSHRIIELITHPKRLLITILLGNELVNVSISAISTSLVLFFIADHFHDINAKWLNICIVVPFLLLFGEVLPKTIAIKNNESFAKIICRWLFFFQKLVFPIVWLVFKVTDLVVYTIVGERSKKEAPIMEEEFINLVEESSEAGIIKEYEKKLIYRVFDLGNMPISNIMAPRGSIFSLSYSMPFNKIIAAVSERHYAAVPIYEGNRDRILGILYAKSLLNLTTEQIEQGQETLNHIMVKPIFIPETKQVYDLFREFKFKKNQIAIVLDEFGGVIGLVTLDDLLEELFGEMKEQKPMDSLCIKKGKNWWLINAMMHIDELVNQTKTPLVNEEFETVGGFVFHLFGRLPSSGESIAYQDLVFTVKEMDITKITEIHVEKILKKSEAE